MSLKNSVTLIGNVGKDPEVTYLPSGSVVANFALATSEPYKDKEGKKVEHTEWHNLVAWGESAKLVEKYVKKGSKLAVEGKLRTRNYEKDSQRHYVTEIIVSEFLFLSPVTKTAPANPLTDNLPASATRMTDNQGPQNDELSDLPF